MDLRHVDVLVRHKERVWLSQRCFLALDAVWPTESCSNDGEGSWAEDSDLEEVFNEWIDIGQCDG